MAMTIGDGRTAPTLEDQIRAQWGNYGEWNAAGVDRAAELAALLRANGINDISGFNYGTTQHDAVLTGQDPMYGTDVYSNPWTETNLTFGDKSIGFLGDANNDGSYSKIGTGSQGNDLVGWSAVGHGNVSYKVGRDPKTGQAYIYPVWGSSSDASRIRNNIIGSAAAIAAPYAAGTLLTGGSLLGAAGAAEGLTGTDAALADMGAGATNVGGASTAGIGSLGGQTLTAEQIAMMSANGMTDAEIAAVAGGQTAADLGGAGAAASAGSAGLTSAEKAALYGPEGYGPAASPAELAAGAGAGSGGISTQLMDLVKANPKLAAQLAGITAGLFNRFTGGSGSGGSGGIDSLAHPQAGMTANQAPKFQRQYVAPPPGYRPGFDPEHKYFTGIGTVGTGG